jgi:DNA-binding MarR family transcriptional regulator
MDEKIKMMDEQKPFWREKIKELTGLEDFRGIEIAGNLRRLGNIYDALFSLNIRGAEFTGPRLGILIRLYIDEMMGREDGITPTFLSHIQNVGKNTISSLIRGLELQGLVKRENDPNDRRIYRLQLTDAGRKLVTEETPKYAAYLNSVTADLNSEELDQLTILLDKLTISIIKRSDLRKMHMHHPHL